MFINRQICYLVGKFGANFLCKLISIILKTYVQLNIMTCKIQTSNFFNGIYFRLSL